MSASLTGRQISQVLALQDKARKAVEAVERAKVLAELAESGADLFARVVTEIPLTDNPERTSAYHSVSKLPFEYDGETYEVTVIATNVGRKAEKFAELEAQALAILAAQGVTVEAVEV